MLSIFKPFIRLVILSAPPGSHQNIFGVDNAIEKQKEPKQHKLAA